MRTIIRIKHPSDGKGLWHHRDLYYNGPLESIVERHELFNTREEDLGYDKYNKQPQFDNLFCAYKSIEQFQQWIVPTEVEWILSKGFNILMIDVSTCIEGVDQILFEKKHILQTKIINSLFI